MKVATTRCPTTLLSCSCWSVSAAGLLLAAPRHRWSERESVAVWPGVAGLPAGGLVPGTGSAGARHVMMCGVGRKWGRSQQNLVIFKVFELTTHMS